MKRILAILALAIASQTTLALPTQSDLDAYIVRANLYQSMQQTPDQIAVSMRNYFGKPYFYARPEGIVYQAPGDVESIIIPYEVSNGQPSSIDLANYASRMNLYISMGQTPDEIVTSLRNYFGKPYFSARSNGWNKTVDIQYQIGSGNEITYLTTLGTVTVP